MHIKHIEKGRRLPSVELLFTLASKLNFSLDALIEKDDNVHQESMTEIINCKLIECNKNELEMINKIIDILIDNIKSTPHN